MNLICGSRQSGVTSSLILRAIKYNHPMVVSTEAHKKEVKKICKKNNWECPVVYTFRGIKEKRGLKLNNLIIDNLDEFVDWCMREIGLWASVDTVGLNIDTKDEKEMFIYKLIDEKNIIKDTCEESINIKDICEENTPIFDVCEENTCIKDTCEKSTNIKDICEDLAQ